MQQLQEFDGKKLKSTLKEGVLIDDEKKKMEELKAEFELHSTCAEYTYEAVVPVEKRLSGLSRASKLLKMNVVLLQTLSCHGSHACVVHVFLML